MRFAIASTGIIALGLVVASPASADEMAVPRGRDAPRPWLVPAGVASATLGSDVTRLRPAGYLRFGLGDVADLSIGARNDLEQCVSCDDDDQAAPVATMAFRLGTDLGELAPLAVLIGFERTVASFGDRDPTFSTLYLSAGARLGSARLSVGAAAFDGRAGDSGPELGNTVRPFGSIEFRASERSKTIVFAEGAFEPLFVADDMTLRWVATGGVRYLAKAWLSSELTVRGGGGANGFIMIAARFHVHLDVLSRTR